MKTANRLVCAFLRRCIRQMQALGLNNTQLAKRLNVSRPYVTKLLSGEVNISFGAAERLARALQMDFLPMLGNATPTPPSPLGQYRFSVVAGSDLTAKDCEDLSRVFSNFYGRWSPSAPAPCKAGERIRMSAARYRDWYANGSFKVARCYLGEKLIGHAVYLDVKTSRGLVVFVVQLVVDEAHRHRGIAKTLLHAAFGFSDYYAWAIVTSSPCTIAALEAATFRHGSLVRMVRDADFIKGEVFSHIPFLSAATPEIDERGSCVNSGFFTDRTAPQPGTEDATARYGLLPEGYEWLAVVFRDQDPDDLASLDRLVEQSGRFVRAAYTRMPQAQQPWAKKTSGEVAAIVRALPTLRRNARICDFGAGCGRHVRAFGEAGFSDVSGVDFARSDAGASAGIVVADCRTWRAKGKFDLVVCLYDVVGSFPDDEDNGKLVGNVAFNLKKGGYAVISVANADFADKQEVKRVSTADRAAFLREICRLVPSNAMSSDGEFFSHATLWDPAANLFYHKEQFSSSSAELPAEYLVVDRRYTVEEIVAIVKKAGLSVLSSRFVRAGFDKDYTRTTGKEILLFCRKGGAA